jgi:hypothetical protein
MKHFLAILLLSALTFGCASKIYQAAPPLANSTEFAEVFIIRNNAYLYDYVGIEVMLDGSKIARLGRRDYIRIKVNPGSHAIGTTAGTVTLNMEQGQAYYFLTSIGYYDGIRDPERLDEIEAQRRIVKSKQVINK